MKNAEHIASLSNRRPTSPPAWGPWVGRRRKNKGHCVSRSDLAAWVAHLVRTCPLVLPLLLVGAAPGLWFSGAEAQAWEWTFVPGEEGPPSPGHYCQVPGCSGQGPAPPCPPRPRPHGTSLLPGPPCITQVPIRTRGRAALPRTPPLWPPHLLLPGVHPFPPSCEALEAAELLLGLAGWAPSGQPRGSSSTRGLADSLDSPVLIPSGRHSAPRAGGGRAGRSALPWQCSHGLGLELVAALPWPLQETGRRAKVRPRSSQGPNSSTQ